MHEGKVSSKYQLTLPAELRRELGVKPGDTVRYALEHGKLTLSVVRPDIGGVLDDLLATHDLTSLQEELGGDATRYVRRMRGWEDADEDDER